MTVRDIIRNKPYLIWHVKSYNHLSDESILENILNFGNWHDVQKFIQIKGKTTTAEIFKQTLRKKRSNYPPSIRLYFCRYFGIANE